MGMKTRALILAALLALLVPITARAADSHAPKGARGDWLPRTEWVMSSWLPYDEARLYALLDTDRAEVDAWLDDHRSLGDLAHRHGVRPPRPLSGRPVGTRPPSPPRRPPPRAPAPPPPPPPPPARP